MAWQYTDKLADFLSGRRVFVTGVCGTVGQALLQRLLESDAAAIIGSDHNEGELFELTERIRDPRVRLILGDIQHRQQLEERFREIDLVVHAAAFKHVGTCERSPRDAVSVNVLGTQNVIDAARAANVERVVFTSSDKAVNPTSVMGTSKLLSERLIAAAADRPEGSGPIFTTTRFGNVLGSSGSVVRVFSRQIAGGGPVTLTDRRMNRFVMTPREAVDLVLESARMSQGGEIFVTKMHALRIEDLAKAMIGALAPRHGLRGAAIAIEEVGVRPGEKLHEELINDEELRRSLELEDFFLILPALAADSARRMRQHYLARGGTAIEGIYRSDRVAPMTVDGIAAYLDERSVV